MRSPHGVERSVHLAANLLDSAPDAILVVDRSGTIFLANCTAETIVGCTREELIGTSIESLVPVALRDIHRQHRATYARARRARSMGPELDLTLLRADGTELPVDISLAPVRIDGVMMVMAAVRDATERRKAEGERGELIARLVRTRERERIAGDLHDDVIQSVYAVGLDLQAARFDPSLSKDQVIDRAVTELKGAISDLRAYMDYLRGEHANEVSGAPTVGNDIFSVRLQSLLRAYGGRPRWHAEFDIDGPLEDAVARELFLIAKELISNTVRHANASDAWIALHSTPEGLELHLEDDGVGFDVNAEHEGSFGLRNLRQRLVALGADLDIASTCGEGTTVVVRVPTD